MEKLLSCPFCGVVGLDFSDGQSHRWGLASCSGCGATCGEVRREYPDTGAWHASAIAEWNTRALPAERAGVVPEGWKLVPVEPTEEMVEAFLGRLKIVEFLARYRAMLAVAPEAPKS